MKILRKSALLCLLSLISTEAGAVCKDGEITASLNLGCERVSNYPISVSEGDSCMNEILDSCDAGGGYEGNAAAARECKSFCLNQTDDCEYKGVSDTRVINCPSPGYSPNGTYNFQNDPESGDQTTTFTSDFDLRPSLRASYRQGGDQSNALFTLTINVGVDVESWCSCMPKREPKPVRMLPPEAL